MSSQICFHTLAVAEQNSELLNFLEWYEKLGQGPNLSSLGLSGLPKGRGQKGGRPKRQSAMSTTPAPDNYSVQSGLVSITTTTESGSITQAPLLQVSSCQQPVSISLSAHPATASVPVLQQASQGIGLPSTQGLTMMNDGHNEQGHAVTYGPPPLISVTQQNVNPFYMKKLTGNIRICQGCRESLRAADGSIPSPPYDIIIAHLEKRPFRDQSGALKTPSRASAAHYHARLACVHAGDPTFLPSALVIPADVAMMLTALHQELLLMDFGLQLCTPC